MRRSFLGVVGTVLSLSVVQAGAQDASLEQFKALNKEIEGLVVYNQLLEQQIQSQQEEIRELQAAMEQVPDLERQLPPVLNRMISGLEEFVALDVPFLIEERSDRVAQLKSIVERADVTIDEKFRRVLEAWMVENEYGRTMDAYVGELEIDGVAREVEFLRIGRVALLYQTPDEEYTGAWDQESRAWVPLSGIHRNSVRQGLQMARAQIAPNLVLLPIPAPSES